jgi:predicted enzyme related to lactoylglutathione lyase
MLRGLTTVSFQTTDLAAAKRWYTELLGVEPYFDTPAYLEWRIGDYQHELGILDSAYLGEVGTRPTNAQAGPAGTLVYWHVDDVEAAVARLVELGATLLEAPRDFGHAFIGASVVDPFGNVLGVMQNPHYLEVLASGSVGG